MTKASTKRIARRKPRTAGSAKKAPNKGNGQGLMLTMTEEQQATLQTLDGQSLETKKRIADLTVSIRQAEQQRDQLIGQLQQNHQQMLAVMNRVLVDHGVDPNDKSKSWNVNIPEKRVVQTA